MAPDNFRLTVLNCNRLWSYSGHLHDGFHGFTHFLASQSCHVALLQEPFCPADIHLPDDQPYFFDGPCNTRGRDVGFLCHEESAHCISPIPAIHDQTNIQWRLLSLKDESSSIALATFYAPHVGCPEHERLSFWQGLFASVQTLTHALPGAPIVLAGDSNVWFPGLVDDRPSRPMDRSCVEQIRLLMSTFGLELRNPRNVPTHRRGAALDLVLATPNTVQTVEVHDGQQCSCPAQSICCPLLGSDHYALTISLTQGVKVDPPPLPTTWRVRDWYQLLQSQHAQMQSWSQQVRNLLHDAPHLISHSARREALDNLYEKLLHIIWGSDPRLYRPCCGSNPKRQPEWWNNACMNALLARNAAWRERRRHPSPATDTTFRVARNRFHRVVRNAKRWFWSSWLNDLENLASTCPREAARVVRRRFRRNTARVAPNLCPQPSAPPDQQQTCIDEWRVHFQVASSQGIDNLDRRHFARVRRRVQHIRNNRTATSDAGQPFTLEELQRALDHCSSGKAPGVDNIPYEAFCIDLPWWKETMLQFLEVCRVLCCVPTMWKHGILIPFPKHGQSSADRDSYRPITLTCCIAKILERMVLNRLHPVVDPRLDECQAGFRTGSDFPAYALLETLHLRKHTRTYCAFLDIRKAFDVAWRDGAMLRLFRAGVSGSLWHLIDDLVSHRTAAVRVSSKFSDSWDVENGIGQGAVLSGFLFNVLVNGLAAEIRRVCNGVTCAGRAGSMQVQILMYADDVVIVSDSFAACPGCSSCLGAVMAF